ASLGFKHVGHDLLYSEVASILPIELSEAEKWAIDGTVCTGLLSGKFSQTTQSLHVYRLSAGMFEREQLGALEPIFLRGKRA
ncbi:hypothetical protein C8R48DRAFT_598794, partial [Suillus tomentosus]